MSCPARLGAFAAVSLVLLRLATGWHFFQEGTNKLNDPTWSSAGFLMQAKGPLADFYHSKVPLGHNWRELLAIPREAGYIDQERINKHREWQEAYAQEVAAAIEAGEPEPFQISQYKPYARWADQIVTTWQNRLERFYELEDFSEAEKEAASSALDEARLQLISYLEGIEPEISEYQHELFRIEQMKKQGATGELAFHDERIQAKEAEAAQMVQPWVAEITAIEENFHAALRQIYRAAQEREEAERAQAAEATEANETADADPADAAAEGETAANDESAADVGLAVTTVAFLQEAAEESEEEPAEGAAEAASADDEPAELDGLPPGPTEPAEGNADSAEETVSEAEENKAPLEEAPEVLEEAVEIGGDETEETSQPSAEAAEVGDEPAEGEAAAVAAVEPAEAEAEDAAEDEQAEAEAAAPEAEEEQPEEEPLTLEGVLTDSREAELALVDKVVTWSHVIIGACLVLGLFTPIAALGGAIFLAMVISTQPPWVPGTQDTYYQFVEMFGLLVLAATCAGRWAGLDYFFACLFGKCRRS